MRVRTSGHGPIRHFVHARAGGPMLLGWPPVFRYLHEALLDDALDQAERADGRDRP